MGACNALREHARQITPEVLKIAEQLARTRAKLTGYRAAIVREDVEQAIKQATP